MNRSDLLDCLQLQDDAILHNDVQASFTNGVPFIAHVHARLLRKLDSAKLQLDAERFLVD